MANTSFALDGRIALVTGGGQGIGEAICRRLAAHGARVAVFDLRQAAAERVAKEVNGLAVAGDATSEADITRALAEAERLSHTGSFGWKASTGEIYWSDETYRIFECEPTTKPTVQILIDRGGLFRLRARV